MGTYILWGMIFCGACTCRVHFKLQSKFTSMKMPAAGEKCWAFYPTRRNLTIQFSFCAVLFYFGGYSIGLWRLLEAILCWRLFY